MTEEQKEKTEEINEILNEFYKLKDKYEKSYYEKYVKKIIKSTNKSNKDKKKEFSRLPKPECVNCARNVGTLFSVVNDEENDRRNFTVKCGDINEPCPLNIIFSYGNRITYEKQIKEMTYLLDKTKHDIIVEKNNALFGYKDMDEATKSFQELTDELKETTGLAGFLIEKNILVNDNPAKKELLNKLQDELQKEYMVPYKQFMYRFIQENNVDFCKDAVELYVNEIIPKLKEIQSLKYGINHVEYDNDTRTFHLLQRPNNLESLEYKTNDDEVVSFVKGVLYKRSSKETKRTSIAKPKNKTIKLKPTIEIVEDEDEGQGQEENEGQEEEEIEISI